MTEEVQLNVRSEIVVFVNFDTEQVELWVHQVERDFTIRIPMPALGAREISVALSKAVIELELHKQGKATQRRDGQTKVVES